MRTILFLPIFLLLGACSSTIEAPEGEMTADAGWAVRHNIAVQTVNPNAPTGKGAFATDGERAFRAQDRYRKGKVTPPANISTGSKMSGTGDDTASGGDTDSSTP